MGGPLQTGGNAPYNDAPAVVPAKWCFVQGKHGLPNQQRTLNNKLPSELRCRFFLLIITDWACELAPNVQKACTQRVHIPIELPFRMPPLVVG